MRLEVANWRIVNQIGIAVVDFANQTAVNEKKVTSVFPDWSRSINIGLDTKSRILFQDFSTDQETFFKKCRDF